MSNPLAIAAVTATLRNVIAIGVKDDQIGNVTVTTLPPDKAAEQSGSRLNLFLFQTNINAGWSNKDFPGQIKPNEAGFPPLSLDLKYVITAYGSDNNVVDQQILGFAMRALHDHPILDPTDIKNSLPNNDLHLQPEHIRISMLPMSQEEMSKLWTTFQTQYRLSVAYYVSVVLIESQRRARAALPVIRRGSDDRGPVAQSGVIPPFPTIENITIEKDESSVLLGEKIVLHGHHLAATNVEMVIRHPLLNAPPPVTITEKTDSQITVTMENDAEKWISGTCGVTAKLTEPDLAPRLTNEMPLVVSPIFELTASEVTRDQNDTATIELTITPPVYETQRVSLLVGGVEVSTVPDFSAIPVPPAGSPKLRKISKLKVEYLNAPAGEFFVRVRVDGADSRLIDRSVSPWVFNAKHKLTIK